MLHMPVVDYDGHGHDDIRMDRPCFGCCDFIERCIILLCGPGEPSGNAFGGGSDVLSWRVVDTDMNSYKYRR